MYFNLEFQIALYEDKERNTEKLITMRVEQKISEYDAQNCSEKEKTLIARRKECVIFSFFFSGYKGYCLVVLDFI